MRAPFAVRVSVALTVAFGVGASTVPPAWALTSGALCALAFLAAFAFAEFPALAAGAVATALEARRLARLLVA
ncbi:hypothetical protein, partial [Enterococcus hirae]|uniref:hypothetical protein n=1 Tax=Enterococcus hirae TaxID=1354 RepID=UPI001963A8D5